jgi:RNA polymerase sigma-70 factor (ECF subfamily)
MPLTGRSVDLESLLAHAGWLTRLAHHLADGGADSDDLVQDTWLSALRSPPDPRRPPRPWLAEVMRNVRRMAARSEARRRNRDADTATAAPPGGLDPQQMLERVELQRLVARLVLDLDEPFRTTVLLRYCEGHSSPEIARQVGVPAGTVRWRLKEAVDRIRRRLDQDESRPSRPWRAILAGPITAAPAAAGIAMAILVAAALGTLVVVGVVAARPRATGSSRPVATAATPIPHFTTPAQPLPPAIASAARSGLHLIDLYAEETRNPFWAPVMERKLRARFDAAPMEDLRLRGATFPEIECRTTMCRIVLRYPAGLWDAANTAGFPDWFRAPAKRFRMWDVYGYATGPIGHGSNVDRRTDNSDGTIDEVLFVFFSGDSLDPKRYDEWQRKARERRQEVLERRGR